MKKLDIKTDTALLFSAIMITIFTIVMVVIFCLYQTVPDSLIVAFFAAFSCEGGFCVFIHKLKKERDTTPVRMGDITGFDDAEVVDETDEGNLVLDLESEEDDEYK